LLLIVDAAHAEVTGIMLALHNVAKIFPNGVEALAGFGMRLRAGELVSLLGPSGCGKSTVLRIIAGLTEPSSGNVEWRDSIRAARQLGFVFQEPTLMPWATVARNVALPLRLQGGSRNADAVNGVLARVGLSDFAGKYPRELSGGMKMRASIARALVIEPNLLLMDEPFAALDEITRFRLNNDLLALWEALQKTIVFVTHSVFESVYLSQRVIVMTPRPGRVFAELLIEAPYPRDERFRTSAAYAASCRRVSEALAQSMGQQE
jgi:NitT/TauT family transport system ATP-binding protein